MLTIWTRQQRESTSCTRKWRPHDRLVGTSCTLKGIDARVRSDRLASRYARLESALACLESGSAVFTRQSTELSTKQSFLHLYGCTVWRLSLILCGLYLHSLCVKRGCIGLSMVPGSWVGAWGIFVFLNTFVFFFRSLALVFQKSPMRNKEATRFTLMRPRSQKSTDSRR